MNSHTRPEKLSSWLFEIVVAIGALLCLLFYFNPRQPEDLVCIEGYNKHPHVSEHRDVFPGSMLLLGMGYRYFQLKGYPCLFYSEIALPYYDYDTPVRVHIRAKDYQRLQDIKNGVSDKEIEIRVYAEETFNPYSRKWTRYVAEHPHGHGSLFAFGILLAILFLVMVVKKVFFNTATKKFP